MSTLNLHSYVKLLQDKMELERRVHMKIETFLKETQSVSARATQRPLMFEEFLGHSISFSEMFDVAVTRFERIFCGYWVPI